MIKYLFTVLISLFLTSCSSYEDISGFFSDEKIYFLSQYENVKAVEQDSQSTGVNTHPIKLNEERIAGAFRQFLVRVGPKTITLFPGDKIELISESISKALAEVGPNEDVVFTIESWYRNIPGKKLSDNRVVSGRVFYNKDGLNLIFGSVLRPGFQSTTDPMLQTRNPDLRKNPYVPGSRVISVKNPFPIVAPPNSGIVRPKAAKGRADWVILTSKALTPRQALTDSERKLARASNIEMQGLKDELRQLKQDLQTMRGPYQQGPYMNSPYQYGAVQRQPYQNNQVPYPGNNGYYPPPPQYAYPPQQYRYPPQNNYYQAPPQQSNVKNLTLKSLEKMRERGLISEENYFKKLKELGY